MLITSCVSKLLKAKLTACATNVNDLFEVAKGRLRRYLGSRSLRGRTSTTRQIYTVRKHSTFISTVRAVLGYDMAFQGVKAKISVKRVS